MVVLWSSRVCLAEFRLGRDRHREIGGAWVRGGALPFGRHVGDLWGGRLGDGRVKSAVEVRERCH